MTAGAPRPINYEGPLGRQVIELHVWAVRQGLLGAPAAELFDGFCRRLISAGVPLWRGYAAMQTLHPQWGGYGYTWWRDLDAVQPEQFERGREYERDVLDSPFAHLIKQAEGSRGE